MPAKKLTALVDPHFSARRMVRRRAARPDPARRRQSGAPGNSAITPAAPTTASRSAIFRQWDWPDAREAGPQADRSRRKGRADRSIGTAPARIVIAHPRRAVRPLRGIADQGRPAHQVAARGDGSLRRNLKPWLSLPAAQFSKADLRAARDAMTKADNVIAANRMLGYLGPVLRWAAQEDLIPVNFVPAIRRAPEEKRTRVLTKKEIVSDLERLRRSRQPRGRKELRPLGEVSAGDRATPRRGGLASLWPYPRRHMAAGHTTNRIGRTASRCRHWRQSLVGRGRGAGSTFSPAAAASSSGFSKLKAEARQGVRRHGLAAARSAAHAPRPTCKSSAFATRWCSRSSIMRCPASAASICNPNSKSKRPKRSQHGRWRSEDRAPRTERARA